MTTWKKINKKYPQSITSSYCQVNKKIMNINSKTEEIHKSFKMVTHMQIKTI